MKFEKKVFSKKTRKQIKCQMGVSANVEQKGKMLTTQNWKREKWVELFPAIQILEKLKMYPIKYDQNQIQSK